MHPVRVMFLRRNFRRTSFATWVHAQLTTPAELQQIFEAQQAAWIAGDGPAWSQAFAADAKFVNIRGDAFHGRTAIAEQHARIFAGPFQGSHTTITIESYTLLAPGVAQIATLHEVTCFKFLPPGINATTPGTLKTRMTYIGVEHDGQWQLAFAQNTTIQPAAAPPPVR